MAKTFEVPAGADRMRCAARPGLYPRSLRQAAAAVRDPARNAWKDAQWKVRQASRLRTSTLQNRKAYD